MPQERRVFEDLITSDIKLSTDSELELSAENAHHLCNVLRLDVGAQITIASKQTGTAYNALITKISGKRAFYKLCSKVASSRTNYRVSTIAPALLKGDKNDFICEKATELGVQKIVFWQGERSVTKFTESKDKKLTRWKSIAESSAKQSHKDFIPSAEIADDITELISLINELKASEDLVLYCSLSPEATPLRRLAAPKGHIHLIIGPEGDFTAHEEALLKKECFTPISLGDYILRSETAAMASIAMCEALFGDIEDTNFK